MSEHTLSASAEPLPLDDPFLAEERDLDDIARHWAAYAAMRPMSAEEMRGADRRAQRLGVPGASLMEQAGAAVALVAAATLRHTARVGAGPVLVLSGAGNNGGDGFVAARYLAAAARGSRVVVALAAVESVPTTRDAHANWYRLDGVENVERFHAATARDVVTLGNGIERASLIVDALLGTGVRGPLREPIRSAVELTWRAREAGVPILAVDCPTALDLTSGESSDPVVRADVTVTFHRPKIGLQTRVGRALAGRVLVAPIGIPREADVT